MFSATYIFSHIISGGAPSLKAASSAAPSSDSTRPTYSLIFPFEGPKIERQLFDSAYEVVFLYLENPFTPNLQRIRKTQVFGNELVQRLHALQYQDLEIEDEGSRQQIQECLNNIKQKIGFLELDLQQFNTQHGTESSDPRLEDVRNRARETLKWFEDRELAFITLQNSYFPRDQKTRAKSRALTPDIQALDRFVVPPTNAAPKGSETSGPAPQAVVGGVKRPPESLQGPPAKAFKSGPAVPTGADLARHSAEQAAKRKAVGQPTAQPPPKKAKHNKPPPL